MTYRLNVHLHPLGVVVVNDEGERELLIEGETCCGIGFDDLRRAAADARPIELAASCSDSCRLHRTSKFRLAA